MSNSVVSTLLQNMPLLIKSAEKGHIKQLKKLVPPEAFEPENALSLRVKNTFGTALCKAAYEGHLQIVQFLLPISNPKSNNSEALRLAAHQNNKDIIRELIPFSNTEAAILAAKANFYNTSLLETLVEEYNALAQQKRIQEQVHHIEDKKPQQAVKRKM